MSEPSPVFGAAAEETAQPAPWLARADSHWTPLRDALRSVDEGAVPPVDPTLEEVAKQAYAKAYAEGLHKARKVTELIMERYQQAIGQLGELRAEIFAQSRADVVALAQRIARQALDNDEAARSDFTLRMATAALELLRDADHITLRLARVDMAALRAKHPELAAMPGLELVEDASLSLGGVVADSRLGRVDAGLQARLDVLAARLSGDEDEDA